MGFIHCNHFFHHCETFVFKVLFLIFHIFAPLKMHVIFCNYILLLGFLLQDGGGHGRTDSAVGGVTAVAEFC